MRKFIDSLFITTGFIVLILIFTLYTLFGLSLEKISYFITNNIPLGLRHDYVYGSLYSLCGFLTVMMMWYHWKLRKQRNQAKKELKENQDQLYLALKAGKIYAWSFELKNPILKSIYGDLRHYEGKGIDYAMEHIIPQDQNKVMEIAFKALKGEPINEVLRFSVIDDDFDSEQLLETEIMLIHETDTRPAMVVGTLKNITETNKLQMLLEDYQIKTNYLTQATGIVLFNYYVNDKVFKQLNLSDNSIRSTITLDEFYANVSPNDRNKAELFIESMNPGTNEHIISEYRYLSHKNKYDWYAVDVVAYKRDDTGKIISYLGLRRKNTKWKKANDDLIRLRNQAEASNKLKSAFLANMSHEIRTPLNAIVGFSDLLAESTDPTEKEQYQRIIQTNNDLLLRLINDVLDLSKIEAGYIDLKYSSFDFTSLFNGLYDTMKMRTPPGVELINKSPNIDVILFNDVNRVSQIITNFITNAFKFTSQGSITMDFKCENDWLKIYVTDTGIGIAKENQDKVFGRFEKLNEFAQGTGLGLSICHSLVETMNGRIGVDSEVGKGSTFWVWLPYSPDINSFNIENQNVYNNILGDMESTEPQQKEEINIDLNKKKILIAEDMDHNYLLAHKMLESEYAIERAYNGQEAVEKARELNPDIILMDMKMPIMDGLEATLEIRKFNPTVPIIALTGYVLDTDRDKALSHGCNGFITKPLKREHLLNEISTVCN